MAAIYVNQWKLEPRDRIAQEKLLYVMRNFVASKVSSIYIPKLARKFGSFKKVLGSSRNREGLYYFIDEYENMDSP